MFICNVVNYLRMINNIIYSQNCMDTEEII